VFVAAFSRRILAARHVSEQADVLRSGMGSPHTRDSGAMLPRPAQTALEAHVRIVSRDRLTRHLVSILR